MNKDDVPFHCYDIEVLEDFGQTTHRYVDVGNEEDWGDIQHCLPTDFGCEEDWKSAVGFGNDADGHRKIVKVTDQEDGTVWSGNGAVKLWYETCVAPYADDYSN